MNEKDSRKLISATNWTLLITFLFFLCSVALTYFITMDLGPFTALTTLTFSTVLQELIALIIPVVLFIRYKRYNFSEYLRIKRSDTGMIIRIFFLSVCGYLFITCFIVLWNIIFDMNLSYASGLEDYISKDFIGVSGTILNVSVFAAIAEETVFRGLLLRGLKPLGDFYAVVLSAFAFALFHLSFSRLGYTFMLGIIIGYVAIITDNILYAVLYHFLHNTFSIFIDITYLVQNAMLSTDRTSYIIIYLVIMLVAAFIMITIFVSIKDKANKKKAEEAKRKKDLEERLALHNVVINSDDEEYISEDCSVEEAESYYKDKEKSKMKNHELTELLYLRDISEEKEYLNPTKVKFYVKDMLGYFIYIIIITYILVSGILGT